MLKKRDYVEIKITILNPDERAKNLPDDTKKVPYEGKLRGYLLHNAEIGELVEIETPIGRIVKGMVIGLVKEYEHNFGEPIRELIDIGKKVREKYLKE